MEKIIEKRVSDKDSDKEIKRVVREYIERMAKQVETGRGHIRDELIDCPQCGSYQSIEYGGMVGPGGWQCVECFFTFPENLVPPIPENVRVFHKVREKIEMFLKK